MAGTHPLSLTGSMASLTQSNTAALANLTFNFSVWKVEAPSEYLGVGQCLSRRRQEAAESGELHAIARKLGALFAPLLPEISNLYKTYGIRASEIADSQPTNSVSSSEYGPFADHAGLDGTNIWAAATSGQSAIAVHLLACILARQWKASVATAIWEELVDERKSELKTEGMSPGQQFEAFMASHITITTQELATWDAGARAWLESADRVNFRRQKQLMLIIDNMHKVVQNAATTYKSIIQQWSAAMVIMDNVIAGVGHVVQLPSVLLGLSAWHLYPDLTVLGPSTQQIQFNDPLIRQGGNLTVGVQNLSPSAVSGVQWSLPLSRLRYYGDVQHAESVLGINSSRITYDQFMYVALGAASHAWTPKGSGMTEAVEMFVELQEFFQKEYSTAQITWPNTFGKAARSLMASEGLSHEYASKLFKLGRRNSKFLDSNVSESLFHMEVNQDLEQESKKSMHLSKLLKGKSQLVDLYRSALYRQFKEEIANIVIRVNGGRGNYQYYFAGGGQTIFPETLPQPKLEAGVMHNATHLQYTNVLTSYPTLARESAGYVMPLNEARISAATRFAWVDHPELVNHTSSASEYNPLGTEIVFNDTRASIPNDAICKVFVFMYGDPEVALFSTKSWRLQVSRSIFNVHDARRALRAGLVDGLKLLRSAQSHVQSLIAIASAESLFSTLPSASISVDVVSKGGLSQAKWHKKDDADSESRSYQYQMGKLLESRTLTRPEAFSCICMFVTGSNDIPPELLDRVMAISSGDSLYIAGALLKDPESIDAGKIMRVQGNIGKPGLALMKSPENPKMQKFDPSKWSVIGHDDYHGEREDNFKGTSLIMSFTEYVQPVDFGDYGDKYIPAYFIETVISAFDKGEWVADLDVLGSLQSPEIFRIKSLDHCSDEKIPEAMEIVAIDNWDELLNRPEKCGIVRAQGNWLSRLALATVSLQKRNMTIILPTQSICWHTVLEQMREFLRARDPSMMFQDDSLLLFDYPVIFIQ